MFSLERGNENKEARDSFSSRIDHDRNSIRDFYWLIPDDNDDDVSLFVLEEFFSKMDSYKIDSDIYSVVSVLDNESIFFRTTRTVACTIQSAN